MFSSSVEVHALSPLPRPRRPLNLPPQPFEQDQSIYDLPADDQHIYDQPFHNEASYDGRPLTPLWKFNDSASTPPEWPDPPPVLKRLGTPPDLMLLQQQSRVLMPHWYKPQFSKSEVISYLQNKDPGWFVIRDTAGGYDLAVRIPPVQIKREKKSRKGIACGILRL